MKKKMDDLTKTKLIYSGELIIIALIMLVIGILEITGVLGINDVIRYVFHFGTTLGSIWMIADFIWTLCSKKRRSKNSLFDKCTILPLGLYLLIVDIVMYINYNQLEPRTYQLFISIALLSLATIYIAQGVYHWFRPLQALVDELEQERIDKITYKVLERKEDGSIIALHVQSNKKYSFKKEYGIKEDVDALFCLDLYPDAIPELYESNQEDNNPHDDNTDEAGD